MLWHLINYDGIGSNGASVNPEFLLPDRLLLKVDRFHLAANRSFSLSDPDIMVRPHTVRPSRYRSRLHARRLWAPVFIMAGISILSGSAGIQTSGWSFVGMDKLGHLVVFGLLGIAWVRCFSGESFATGPRLLAAVVLATAFGLADELHQLTNPLRTFEYADLLADFLGAIMGSWIYLRSRTLRRLMEIKIGGGSRLPSGGNPPN